MYRGVLLVVALGGCYSPKFDTCSLTCAAEEVCPNGFECSNGRCAIEGTSCLSDAGGGADNNTAGCSDGTPVAGEICFKMVEQFNTGVAGIFDTQFVDGNGDGLRDLAFLTMNSYMFRLNQGGTFSGANTVGPLVEGGNRMRGSNLNTNSVPELINNNKVTGNIEIWSWNGSIHMLAASLPSETSEVQGIALGHTTGLGADPGSIGLVFGTHVHLYQLPNGGNLSPLTQSGTGATILGGKDLAIADTDDNGVDEIGVAETAGVEIFKNLNANLTSVATVDVGVSPDSLTNCDVDGDGDEEFIYSIRSMQSMPGRIGAIRWVSGSSYELLPSRAIPNQFAPVECKDFDMDTHGDAVVAAGDGNGNVDILIMRGRADGTFEAPIRFRIPSAITHLRVNGDFNNDGVPDIAMTSAAMGLITILESDP